MSCSVLHAANMRQPAIGVVRQMEDEQRAADSLGIDWRSRLYCPPGTDGEIVVHSGASANWWSFKRAYYRWLVDEAAHHDVVLLRYSMYDPLQRAFVRRSPVPVVTMHHTIEASELLSRPGARARLRAAIESRVGPGTLRAAAGVAAITREIADHQLARAAPAAPPTFRYSNGAFYGPDPVVAGSPSRDPIELLLVSSRYAPWIGLDIIVDAARRSSREFVLHIGGHLEESQIASLGGDPRLVTHGYLDAPALSGLMSRCALGLAQFGLHRKGLSECDTLKAREYLRAGLPVYAGYRDVFDEGFPWFRQGPADFDDILGFAKDMLDVQRARVSSEARPWIDKTRIVADMHAGLCAQLGATDRA